MLKEQMETMKDRLASMEDKLGQTFHDLVKSELARLHALP